MLAHTAPVERGVVVALLTEILTAVETIAARQKAPHSKNGAGINREIPRTLQASNCSLYFCQAKSQKLEGGVAEVFAASVF
jgi:hypothetical protein